MLKSVGCYIIKHNTVFEKKGGMTVPRRGKRAPHGGIDESYWDTLDNAAKLFPAITSTRSPNVFRFTAVLRENVVPEALEWALERALSIMPSFALRLHRGFFWYYFDANNEKTKVRPEKTYPCAPIYRAKEKGYLFRVTYFGKRINFELYHVLSDGMGASKFVRLLVYCYFHKLYGKDVPEEVIRREISEAARDFDEDAFTLNMPDGETDFSVVDSGGEAFRINGYSYDGTRLGVLSAIMPFDSLRSAAKEYEATLSEYVCALLIYSIYNTNYRRTSRKLPIAISMPVNLRGMFDSITLKNFFGHMKVSIVPTKDMTFEDILNETKAQFKKSLVKSRFEKQISDHVNIERIPGIKFVPLFLKNIVMRCTYAKSLKKYTMTFSNLGKITLPETIADKVERFEVMIGGSATHPKKLSLCTYENNLALTFTSTVDDNSLEKFFVSFLTEKGIDVVISSNETPPPVKVKKEKPPKPPKEKKTKEKKAKKEKPPKKKASKKGGEIS